jgi:hypothetical protein
MAQEAITKMFLIALPAFCRQQGFAALILIRLIDS